MRNLLTFLVWITGMAYLYAQTPAFPGAEGGGKYTAGGRGGAVYYVNTLEDTIIGDKETHEGSLRWCLQRNGAKTILFKVAGIIRLKSKLSIPDSTTIAGQSAPGDGICIADNSVRVEGSNVIIRYMRFRMGNRLKVEDDALCGNRNRDIIIDHCSMSWGTDECSSFYDNDNFTMQWCVLSESLRASVHRKGNHGYGGIWGGRTASFHHNLLAHHDSRNPRMCGSRYSNRPDEELVDFRNNVIYNWGGNSGYAGEGGRYNFVNNYYKASPTSSNPNRIFSPNADAGVNRQPAGAWGKFYLSGNYVHGQEKTTADNVIGLQPEPGTKDVKDLVSATEFKVAPVATDDAKTAYERVLAMAGASFKRDNTDKRIMNEVKNGLTPVRASGNAGTRPGMIDSQEDSGGWDTYSFNPGLVPTDKNIDGIPDGWLEKNFPGKRANDRNEEGYTYLEVYLNSLPDIEKTEYIVDRNGTGDFRNIQEAINAVRTADPRGLITIRIKNGVYKEKLVIPPHVTNIKLVGEDRDKTIINYDDHANINRMGTFKTYTFLLSGNDIILENLTIENSSLPLGQAVALHIEGDRIIIRNCRLLGHQDTLYAGRDGARQYFENCYIEGTTDFIFGPSTAWFENCTIHCKKDSYITAANTPQNQKYGYIFNKCTVTAAKDVKAVYLGRPWRAFAMTLFMNCRLPKEIRPEGWENWRNPENEKTARYMEFNNTGEGADTSKRVKWAKSPKAAEAKEYTVETVLSGCDGWKP